MTKSEIVQQVSMREVVENYGFKANRAGFISCPFHKGDHTASMKIYDKSFHCFGCGVNGDIFSFVQKMDNCDFKTAFYSLGGTYQKQTDASKLALHHLKKEREKKEKRKTEIKRKMQLNNTLIGIYVVWMKRLEPLSDAWCDCVNEYTKCLGIDEELEKEWEEIMRK